MGGEKISFCQVDAHLDTNPKIRRAGRDGRDVFEFLLRRVAIGRTEGTVPLKYLEPWYLADQLMMSEGDASNGVSRAVTANLIAVDDVSGVVRIVGWSDEWGRRPKTNAERQAEYRARKSPEPDTASYVANAESREVTPSNESNALDKKRREKKKSEEREASPSQPGPGQQTIQHFDARYGEANDGQKPEGWSKQAANYHRLAKKHGPSEVIARIDRLFDGRGPSWLKGPFTPGTVVSQWDALVSDAAPQQRNQPQHPGEFRPREIIA